MIDFLAGRRHADRGSSFLDDAGSDVPPVRPSLLASPFLLLAMACAGSLASLGSIEQTIGRASYHDILTEVPQAFRRNGYAIYQSRETPSTIYIETNWQDRAPFEDEAGLGADNARTRFRIA